MKNKKQYTGVIKINGKSYSVEVINGEQFIEGKTVDEFLKTLPSTDLIDLMKLGGLVVEKEIIGKGTIKKQKFMDELYQAKNN